MIKKNKIPTILGLIILLAGTFAGVFFLNVRQVFKIGASPADTPKDVRISNISDRSVSITWITDNESVGFVKWGVSENNLNKIENESATNQKHKVHQINISGLSPNSDYFFKINSNSNDYDNNSLPWKFSTGSELDLEGDSLPVIGNVITASGTPVKRAIVYMNIAGYLMSTLTSDSGSYVFQLGNARDSNLKNYISVPDDQELLLEVSVQSDSDNFATAQISSADADPIPTIIMGQSMDFRNLTNSGDESNPNTQLSLPMNQNQENSKFQISGATTLPTTTVILESHKNGEIISTDKPQFFGKGPSGQELTITVHSPEEILGSVKIPKNGSWNWSPPQNLSAGEHTITVSWIDTSGITRSLVRKFVVQAAEVPAFTASQSGTIATPIPTPSPIITPVPSITPSNTPIIIPTDSPQPVPETGSLTPTLFLFIMSIGILVFSFGVWKISENA